MTPTDTPGSAPAGPLDVLQRRWRRIPRRTREADAISNALPGMVGAFHIEPLRLHRRRAKA